LKGEPPPSVIATRLRLDFLPPDAATLPIEYVEDENHRVDIFRRIAALADETETAALRAELRDRFGPLPREAERLLRLADLRIRAQRNGIGDVETRDGRVLLRRGADYLQTDGRMPRLKKDALDDRLDELSDLIRNLTHPA